MSEWKNILRNGKLIMICSVCESEMIALHGFLVVCPNCPQENEPYKSDTSSPESI